MDRLALDIEGMRQLLGRFEALPAPVLSRLNVMYAEAWAVERRDLLLPRDHSWDRAQHALDAHRLREEFNGVWMDVIRCLRRRRAGPAMMDALGGTLVGPCAGHGPFRPSDRNLLLAPWRAVVEGCARSRLVLEMAHGRTGPGEDSWWVAADAVLATGQDATTSLHDAAS